MPLDPPVIKTVLDICVQPGSMVPSSRGVAAKPWHDEVQRKMSAGQDRADRDFRVMYGPVFGQVMDGLPVVLTEEGFESYDC